MPASAAVSVFIRSYQQQRIDEEFRQFRSSEHRLEGPVTLINQIAVISSDAASLARNLVEEARQISSLQHPETYAILRNAEDAIRAQFDSPPPIHPVLASWANGSWNAASFRLDDEYVVVFDERTLEFTTVTCDAIVSVFLNGCRDLMDEGKPVERDLAVQRIIAGLDKEPSKVWDLISANITFQNPSSAEWRSHVVESGPHPQSIMADTIRHALIFFTMAHEYAHILLGHIDGAATPVTGAPSNVEELRYNRQMEEEADGVAIVLAHQALSRGDPSSSLTGLRDKYLAVVPLDLMLMNVGLQGVTSRVLQSRETYLQRLSQSTHPPTETRRRKMLDMLNLYYDDIPEDTKSIRRWVDLLYAILASETENIAREFIDDFASVKDHRSVI